MTKRLTPIARKLRANPTDAEQRLWSRLRGSQLGVRFTRQHPIGPYVVDFVCRSARLVIEVDGGQHADSTHDAARTRIIKANGYLVLRFWNSDVLANPDGVAQVIADALKAALSRELR